MQQLNTGLYGQSFFRIGTFTINSNDNPTLHVKSDDILNPVLQLVSPSIGTIRHLYTSGLINYGIYQTGSSLQNYFEGSVVCNSDLKFNSLGNVQVNGNQLPFGFRMSEGLPSVNSFTIFDWGARVYGKLDCDTFLLRDNPGLGKVLVSNENGKGVWTDPSNFNDNDWLVKYVGGGKGPRPAYLYLNPDYIGVGIGTDSPMDKFQVNDGFEKFVVGTANYATLGTGTTYIGFNSVRTTANWVMSSNGTSNGGNITYGDISGNYHIVTVPSNTQGSTVQNLTDASVVEHIRMTVTKDGDVGIGTRNPVVALDVNRTSATTIRSFAIGPFAASIWSMNSNGGYGLGSDENGKGHLYENANNPSPIMTFRNGRIGIGYTDFDDIAGNHKLFVAGGITAEEVKVKLKGEWHDKIFLGNYRLLPLSELEIYVKMNQHLPDIPTETEVRANGINLGEMNALLLKKVEELTLYIIDQQKQINTLKQSMNH